ncbi:hypothetical protein [Paraburkholderia sp. J8-2]|uniref:hypothetical protein n=1 Tax=Paraburkholderia sp. J8-2 TaxID=2805440 RepID=UPI002AB6E3C4|nr:hypothetical protein [Paraburkholderia sp. J8-2]
MLNDFNTCNDIERRLWVVTLQRQIEPRVLVFHQCDMPCAHDVYTRLVEVGQFDALPGFTTFELSTSLERSPGSVNALDAWARQVLAEGVSVGPLVDVAPAEFSLTPWKRVRYDEREQFFDDGGCLQGEVHYGKDGAPTRWLVDETLLSVAAAH